MLVVAASLVQPVTWARAARQGQPPGVTAGAGPVDRPAPASARPDEAVPPEKWPPVVPVGVRAGGEPVRLSAEDWARVPKPGQAEEVFAAVLTRPGFALGDTSLVAYFDVREDPRPWSAWRARVFEASTGTEQASTVLPRSELQVPCGAVRQFCRTFGGREGWVLDPAKEYFVTLAAILDGGGELVSAPGPNTRPRTTAEPPPIPIEQASGCGCGTALSTTGAGQAFRGDGVNTATGAFTRIEPDLSMASIGVPFTSTRVYSSTLSLPGLFGPGWAWTYGMRVTPTDAGAMVLADDGAQVLYRLVDGSYQRPAGIRSTLRKTDGGWELVTLTRIAYGFDGEGRLTSVRTARGVGVSLAHNPDGITITDASGRTARARVVDGLIRMITLPDHRKVHYEYDAAGRLAVYKDARGGQWRYAYSAEGRLTEVQDPQPHRTTLVRNEYDAAGRVARQSDAVGNTTSFAWNAAEQEATTTDADGVIVRDGYRGNVLVYSRRGAGDTDNHRYDGSLNRSLLVNGNHNQHEAQHDLNGNPTVRRAPQGFDEKTKYDERNNPIEFTDANGNVWKNTYNEFNELVRSADAENHSISHAYDERGLRTSTTDQRGKVTRYEHIPLGQPNSGLVSAVVSPEGRRSEVEYDDTGRRVATVDPRGTPPGADRRAFTTRYRLDEQDRVVEVHEPGKRHPWRTHYDEVGRVSSTINPEWVKVEYRYFDNGRLASVADARKTTSITYTNAGRRAAVRIEMGHGQQDIVTSYRYNAKGLLHRTISPRGNVPGAVEADFTTTYRYDANDNLVRISRPYPGGKVVHKDIKVDELDRTTSTVDEFNKPSTFARDNTGRVTGATDTLGRGLSMGYDRNGRQTTNTDAGRNTTKSTYDEAGNKVRQESATGGVTTWEYSDDGLLISTTEPRGNVGGADRARFTTRFEYDLAGNRTKVIDPLGNATVSAYDANNRLSAMTDPNNHATHYRYREDNQIESVHAPDAKFIPHAPHVEATVYSYHKDGLLAAIRDPNHHVRRIDYDRAGRPTSTTDPKGRRVEATYDVENNLIAAITKGEHEWLNDAERAKRTIVDTYDIVNRRVTRALGDSGPKYSWAYDAKDRITAYGDPLGVRKMSYDDEDQITRVTREEAGGRSETFDYDYDQRGNITSRAYPDGTRVTAGYDADSRVSELTVRGGSAGADAATWRFGYDVAGRRTSTTLPAATGLVERRTYDDAGRLTAIGTDRTPGAGPPPDVQDPISAFKLDLDPVGNPIKVTTTRGGVSEAVAYAYDPADRVTSACYAAATCDKHAEAAGRIDYSYDLVGNRLTQKRTGTAGSDSTRYVYDSADQLTKRIVSQHRAGSAPDGEVVGLPTVIDYDYDINGNQTRAGRDTFTYNLDNTLASATTGGRTTTFSYDATGLRVAAASGDTQRWSWDVNGTLPQIALDTTADAAGTITERRGFAYGPDDEPLALLDSSVHSYTHDWLGGVANMLSPTGVPEGGYDYDPFGNPREGATLKPGDQAGPANPLRFTGAYQDSKSGEGNYYLRARNYNPDTGRFTSTDPMPQPGPAISAYAYAENNPLSYTDPTGAVVDNGGGSGSSSETGATQPTGPSPEDVAKAQQIQSKSLVDVILEGGGQILMEFLGINDIVNCLKGDIGACVSVVIGALPWGKIFKAKKIAEAIFRAGKAVVTFFQELKWARAIIQGAEKAAEAAKAAAAAAAKAAAEKAAKARAVAEDAAKRAAAKAAERAKAVAAKAKAATKKPPKGCKTHSFAAGTLVLLADGTRKPIEQVKPGDKVQATEPGTGKTEGRQVTRSIRTDHDKSYVDVTVRDDSGSHTITTTDNHPFWSVTRGRWVDAAHLKPGELLRTAAGTHVQIGAVRAYAGVQRTFDLTVDGTHTYYVVAGSQSLLVHNVDACDLELVQAAREAAKNAPKGVSKIAAARLRNAGNGRPGEIETAYSGAGHGDPFYEDAITERLPRAGGTTDWDSTNCAEVRACNRALGGAPDDELATLSNVEYAVVDRDGNIVGACASCLNVIVAGGARSVG
ncbi:RHS repeat-associated protein [Saccharothrix ecbatanensis]|uniref:RHS repeat-associated protein n=1 Tax=Saccharothrix ecbatanensis TaxID=1105145 RepID=A0A7W9HIJ5_9PSEU|nr:RHS repeat-associated core domain-containing protein [Saccharothrix ecbatanensis]MBB5802860.1 RHS repeat-associated protein [Saccharothrix ecbatanensis]